MAEKNSYGHNGMPLGIKKQNFYYRFNDRLGSFYYDDPDTGNL